jgi:hypothetical protein
MNSAASIENLPGRDAENLLVEDNQDSREGLAASRRLATRWCRLATAASEPGRAPLPRPDSDGHQLPEVDGWGDTAHPGGGGTRHSIIALTAHALTSDRQKTRTGCDDYHTKPSNFPAAQPDESLARTERLRRR